MRNSKQIIEVSKDGGRNREIVSREDIAQMMSEAHLLHSSKMFRSRGFGVRVAAHRIITVIWG